MEQRTLQNFLSAQNIILYKIKKIMSDNKTIVNSWNEWDPLKHVIVGRADGTCIPAPEPALDAKVPEDSDMRGQFGPRTKDTVDKANQLLNDFSNMLIKRGIKVDRPTPIDFNQKLQRLIGKQKPCLVACPQEMFCLLLVTKY
jgi:hypothetical protein